LVGHADHRHSIELIICICVTADDGKTRGLTMDSCCSFSDLALQRNFSFFCLASCEHTSLDESCFSCLAGGNCRPLNLAPASYMRKR
jgi:hypothetical protein